MDADLSDMTSQEPRTLESSRKLFNILEHVVRTGGVGVTETAEELSLPKSTVHLYLQSLVERGHVIAEDGRYRPSLELLEWGDHARNDIEVYRKGRTEVDALAEKTNELANLGVVESDAVRLVHLQEIETEPTESSAPSISTEFSATAPNISVLSEDYQHTLGKKLDIHATAMGKAMLAEMPRERVESIVDRRELTAHTEHTITDPGRLFDELETIQSRGYAVDDQERVEGLYCIAAAVCENDRPLAAVSVSGLAKQWNGEYKSELAEMVTNTAHVIEIKLTHS